MFCDFWGKSKSGRPVCSIIGQGDLPRLILAKLQYLDTQKYI